MKITKNGNKFTVDDEDAQPAALAELQEKVIILAKGTDKTKLTAAEIAKIDGTKPGGKK